MAPEPFFCPASVPTTSSTPTPTPTPTRKICYFSGNLMYFYLNCDCFLIF